MMSGRKEGVISQGIWTPLVVPGDDLKKKVVDAVLGKVGKEGIDDTDIVCVTEAVLAISQENFVTQEDIVQDLRVKFAGAKAIAVVDPIQSRNRFLAVLKAIAAVPEFEKIYIILTYPTDEVGNRLVSNRAIKKSGINPYQDVLSVSDFYAKLGVPNHPFTGMNYIEEYEKACNGKAEVILCNNMEKVPSFCKDVLICNIHERDDVREDLEAGGATRILDLSQIMDKPVKRPKNVEKTENKDVAEKVTETEKLDANAASSESKKVAKEFSGYNEVYGLYGSNLRKDNELKLMPRESQAFAEELQAAFFEACGKRVEVLVYGDGAFKDPVGHIWELADPDCALGYTEGLKGTPEEVKLKYIASVHEGKSEEEIEEIVAKEKAERKRTKDVSGEASLGTTPRRICDLVGSLSDLTTGSGDRQTPTVLIKNYL